MRRKLLKMYRRAIVSLAAVAMAGLCVSCHSDVSNAPPHASSGDAVGMSGGQSDSSDTSTAANSGDAVLPPFDFVPTEGDPLGGCAQCHVDVEDAMAGTSHLKEGVGCKRCHGPSEGHLADENNEVLPDHVFTRENVDEMCVHCHDCSRPKEKIDPSVPAAQQKVCTDCHHAHTLKRVGCNRRSAVQ